MVDISVDTFKAKLIGGLARPNLFRVIVNFPAYAQGDVENTSFFVKNAQFPPSSTEAVEVPYRGRMIPLEGDRTFDPITLTIYNDIDHPIREAFIRWKNEMSNHSSNTGLSNPADYYVDMQIEQLEKGGNVTVVHNLRGAWPLRVGEIELAFDANNTVEEFTVDLRYLYWDQNGVTT